MLKLPSLTRLRPGRTPLRSTGARRLGVASGISLDPRTALAEIARCWPGRATRVGLVVGNDLDADARRALRALRARQPGMAVERADSACHLPARAVINRALGSTRFAPDELVGADGILCIGDPVGTDAQIAASLLTARAAGAHVMALHERPLAYSPTEPTADIAEIAAVLRIAMKRLLATGAIDRSFIAQRTHGADVMLEELEATAHGPDQVALDAAGAKLADFVEASNRLAVVWRPDHDVAAAELARTVTALLLLRGAVGRPGSGLCLVGPAADADAFDPCSTIAARSAIVARGVVERAQLGDFDVLLSIGREPFAGAEHAIEDAWPGVPLVAHLGTAGADAVPGRRASTLVLFGSTSACLEDLNDVLACPTVDVGPPDSAGAVDRYAFVSGSGRHAS